MQKRILFEGPQTQQMNPGLLALAAQILCSSVLLYCSSDGDLSGESCGVRGCEVKGWHFLDDLSFAVPFFPSFISTQRESVSTTTFPTLQLGAFTMTSKRCTKHS